MVENLDMDASPSVSIVMGVYGGLESLPVTVETILQQTFNDFEIVIVDDGNCLQDYASICEVAARDSRIRVLRHDENLGLTKALATGCAASRGQYIARIDNGDLMVPLTRLENQFHALENQPQVSLVSGGMIILDLLNKDAYQSKKNIAGTPYGLGSPELKQVAHVTVMFRADDYVAVGGYDESMKTGQDVDLWPRILSRGSGLLMDEFYAVAPMRPASISVAKNNAQLADTLRREISSLRSKRFSVRSIPVICGHLIKLLIPISTRVKLRYRKNFDYIGKYPKEDDSLNGAWEWYRANFD